MKRFMMTTALALGTIGLGSAAYAQQPADPGGNNAPTCETPWQAVDADNSRTISRDEAEAHVKASFAMLDNDDDGTVTRAEYRDCLARSQTSIDDWPQRDEESFTSADANSDGSLDRDEYGQQASKAFDKSRDMGDASDVDYRVLRSFVLLVPDETEDPDFMQSLSAEQAGARAALNFALLDRDDDGKISEAEWNNESPPDSDVDERVNASFDKLDEDSSGSLSEAELRSTDVFAIDPTTTASTTSSETGSTGGNDAGSSSDQQASMSSEATGAEIPVFLYVFEAY